MSTKKKYDAALLVVSAKNGLLGEDVLPAFKLLSGLSSESISVSEECLWKLERLEIGRRDINILDGSKVFVLSNFGKKVMDVMRENAKEFVAGHPGAAESQGERGIK